MLTNNFTLYSGKILYELLRDILYFPIWWYSQGLVRISLKLKDFLINKQKKLALVVWVKNIFRPMYGQYDWQGMIISFFMRVVQIIFRSIIFFLWITLALLVFCFWLILPVLVVYEILFQTIL